MRSLTALPVGVAARPPSAVSRNSTKRHIRRGDRVHRADDVALDARDLDKARDGVAHKAHQIFERHRHGVADLLIRAAAPEMPARYAITAPMPEATYSASSSSCCV